MYKSIILGGMGMKMKHLLSYNQIPVYKKLTHNTIKLCSVYLHPEYNKRLNNVIEKANHNNQNLILHCMSSTCWYSIPFINNYNESIIKNKYKKPLIKNLILESPTYHFNIDSLINHNANMIQKTHYCNKYSTLKYILNNLIKFSGATDKWKTNYINTLENISGVENVLIVGSKKDELINYNQFEELSDKLNNNGKKVELVLSEKSRHNLFIKDDPIYYYSSTNKWYNKINN